VTESAEASLPLAPPVTGNHEIDRALASLDLGDDVAEHPGRIAEALDVVQRALAGPSVPQALRPR
jgi:hypothetical protein